ncbi:PREDICTED: uncharacterized protein LOC109587936, partial [Amphimedon queenslandica]|uniref:AAA+ ATPase domain-containing protein n=1 Tax=Amphimedon queenslandica TaxID=400682 RepID=A0AAN0JS64_AMPQE
MNDANYSQHLEVSIQNFAEILESVKEKFLNILTGAAVYADIASIANCFSKGMGITREINIISDCKEFQNTPSHDTIQSFKNVFVLHQIAEHIDALYDFCHDFELQKCMADDHFKKLREIVLARKSWQQESIRNLCSVFNEIQELLGIKKVKNFKEFAFLELFRPLYTQTKELRDFMTENNFRGKGKDRFLKLFDLVTQACQHDEYNAEDFHSFAVLHQCHKFTVKHLIQALYSINCQFPKCYELLRCHSGTTLNDIQLFFQRIEFFPRHYYFLQVDQLNSKLQESLVQYYLELYDKMLKCDTHARSTLHFIETSASLLQNAPFISTVVKNEENLQKVDISFWSQPQLVYGLQGNGKTHYIRSQLTANNVVFAVNELFSVEKVIDKLKLLCDEKDCSIFFNFTLLPPGKNVAEEERKEFEALMNKIGWFIFDFLVLGYIQDPHTGASFSVPLTENWKIFVEVPSIYNDPESNLETFRELLPTFTFVGTLHHIDSSLHYEIDDDVQLVCKYLKAYKYEQENPGTREGINKLFNDLIQIPVKFSTEADFDDPKECLSLLYKYMPDYIAERKISQKLFIKRECGMPVIIEGETGVGKTALLRMLSKLWNYRYETELKSYEQRLKKTLTYDKRRSRLNMSLQQQLSQVKNFFENEEVLTAGGSAEAVDLKRIVSELKKIGLELKKTPSLSVLVARHDTKEEFWRIANSSDDDIDTKDLFKLLDGFATAEVSTFHKLDVHAGLKTHDITSFFEQVNEQAKQICICFEDKSQIPQVTAYLDEINTSSCMGLFKEIIIDRTIDGEAMLDNVFIIAACNPLRGDSTIHLQNAKNVWVKPSYYVRELHPTIDYLKWDYGALNNVQEEKYIAAKMNDCTKDQPEAFTPGDLTYFIVESQNKMRLYADRMLKNKGIHKMEAEKCSRSCVSQRDIQRVFDFYKWLFDTYKAFQRYTTTKEQQIRALLVSLGLVYYLRLQELDRESYAIFLDTQCKDLLVGCNFTTAFNDELEWYIERMNLPPGIAKTRALKENIFANIACCQTHTPLIIIGEPGTSKTLSFNLVSSTFKGKSSKNEELKNANAFHALQPFFYQCSKHTNSVEVENIFKQAIQRQRVFASSNVPTYCVVFMDEAGLPEERHESLKVLHYHLDKREMEVSYCQMKHRNVLEMVNESLHDLPRIIESEKLEENELDIDPDLANYTENNVRYKLIIDSSEDDSAVRYLFSCNILDRQKTQMVACSEFFEESGMHVNTIAEIIHSAENGDTIIMFQTDRIHESFYELFNQRFRIIHDPQKGIKLFTNISIGAHTKPCRVQAQFQCIVVVKKSELKNTPQAFLSRFEKFFFSYNTLCSSISETKPPNLKIIINAVFKKIATFVDQLNASKSFYGYCAPGLQDRKSSDGNSTTEKYENAITTHETLYSLLLSMLPSVQHIYEIGCYIPTDHFDDDITEENIDKKCLLILTTAIEAMKQYCDWIIPK